MFNLLTGALSQRQLLQKWLQFQSGRIDMDPNAEDLAILEVLKRMEPAIVGTDSNRSYALVDSIPCEVLEACEALTPSVKYVKVRTAWCLTAGDWSSFRTRLISKLLKRMASRSLELGVKGPSPDDLKHAPVLGPWIVIQDPQHDGAIMIGTQAGHPTLKRPLINTLRLCGIDVGKTWARTATRWYRLGNSTSAVSHFKGLGPKAAGLEHLELEFWQVQAMIAEDRMREGFRDE